MNRNVFFKPLAFALVILLTAASCRNRDTVPRVEFTIDLTQPEYQALNATGGEVVVQEYGVLVAKSFNGYLAVSSQCTAHGCVLDYQPSYDVFQCPCATCQYNTQGGVMMGPATQPIVSYATQLNGQWLRVYTP